MNRNMIMGAAFALFVATPGVALAAECCPEPACCDEGRDCCEQTKAARESAKAAETSATPGPQR